MDHSPESVIRMPTPSVAVWDWPVRIIHWLLVVCLLTSLVSVNLGWMLMHFYAGYALSGLLLFRIIWGFIGTTYARFSSFNLSLTGAAKQLKSLIQGNAQPYLGHNPAGSVMVLLLLATLALQVITGLFYSDGIFWYGPLYDYGPNWWLELSESVHPQLPGLILLLVGTHILAVLYHKVRFKEPLTSAMFHGRKPSGDPTLARSEVSTLWLLFTLVATGLWLAWLATRPL